MPVALLVGILAASVVINVALIVLVARADDFALRLPRLLRPVLDLLRSHPPADETPRRRRATYVAGQRPRPVLSAPPPVRMSPSPIAGVSGLARMTPPTETLPPDLAEFLARPAEIAMPPEAAGRAFGAAVLGLPDRRPASVTDGGFGRDRPTGLEGPASWGQILEVENARLLRHRRPVTIVMVELEGLQRPADRLGDERVRRLLPVVADALVREARSSDWVARIGDSHFAALLPETDEIQAINYVERVRAVCEPWLASAAVQLRLAIGWSSPTPSSDLEFAIRRAEERMNADRRTPGGGPAAARVVSAAFVTLASRVGGGDDGGMLEARAALPETEAAAGRADPAEATEPAATEPSPQLEAAQSGRASGRRKRGADSKDA